MGLLDVVKGFLNKPSFGPSEVALASSEPELELPAVAEVDATELMVERQNGKSPLLLDCRESYEWVQMRIPGSLHMPMGAIPHRLAELEKEADIVVVCAHGFRSYTVAGYLTENGFSARSLKGGLANWQVQGGDVESDYGKTRKTRIIN
jgi:rhodanese-related sulfurtransferase